MSSLNNFFYPGTVCIVGASTKEKSIGYEILKTIKNYGYGGQVLPVNPKADEVLGYKCFHSIEAIDANIDLAVVVVPKQFAEESIDQLLAKNVESIILITAGFKEIGKEGEELEKRILEKIKSSGARMAGPNCMGVINTLSGVRLNATFVAEKPETGATGFLSQSGALGAAVLNSLRETDIKFAHFISVGNKADINENDILHFWQNDPNIKTLTFYLESFVNGLDFLKPFAAGEISKPAIVLKAGRTKSGMKAASSHTGALGSEDKVVNALLKQFGIIRAENLNELFNTAKGFENFDHPKGPRVAVITNAGGPAILCVDAIEKRGLKLAELSDRTKNLLKEFVHPEGSVENPVDLLPGGNAEIFKKTVETAAADENVDAVISIFVEPVMVSPFEVVENISAVNCGKPILQVVMPLPEFWDLYRNNSSLKKPLFKNPEDPAEILSNILFHNSSKEKIKKNKTEYRAVASLKKQKNSYSGGFLQQEEIASISKRYDIPLIKSEMLPPAGLNNFICNYYPVVLKGINKKIIHKSELNAVKLNIASKDELLIAAEEIERSFRDSGFHVESYLVQQFAKSKHELLVGGFRDSSFGPVIMFGSGGKYVEVYSDTSIKSAYLCDADLEEMINETAIGKIIRGVRGEKDCDIPALKKIILKCAHMMIENEDISEFDLNPLIYTNDGNYLCVDARIKIA